MKGTHTIAAIAVAAGAAAAGACGGGSSSSPGSGDAMTHAYLDGGSASDGPAQGEGSDGAGDTDGGAAGDAAVTADAEADAGAPGVRWVGRVDTSDPTPGALGKFAWSAAGFIATVAGTKISVRLQTEGSTSSAFFQPIIDGTSAARFQVMTGAAQTVVLGTGLSAGDHAVELYRDTEGMYGDTVFFGFPDGTLKAPPPQKGRLIEIVGDSISAGYGNLGSETHPPWTNTCTFSLDTESAYQAYGAILGRALDAEVSIIARSGWGMYRDLSGNTANVLSSVYANTVGTEPTPAWSFARKPDAVVIDLGTNDSNMGDPGQPYEDAYVAFLRTVRGHYPSARIFLTIGPMTSDPTLSAMRTHLANVVSTMADSRITTVDIAAQDGTSTGCDFHPNVAEDMVMATALEAAMKPMLGW